MDFTEKVDEIASICEGTEPQEVRDYKTFQKLYELPEFGVTLNIKGEKYKVVGFKRKNRKYPVICEHLPSGKKYKFPASVIRDMLKDQKHG